MRQIKIRLIALLLLSLFMLSGCTDQILESINTKQQDQLMVNVFNAIEDEDYKTVEAQLTDEVLSETDVEAAFQLLSQYIDGHVSSYKKTGYYMNTSVSGENKTVSMNITYDVATESQNYVVSMVLVNTEESNLKIYSFRAILSEELEGNGAVINFKEFDFVQLLMLLYSAGCIGFMIYAIVVCAKSKVRLKALWIIVIILISSGVSITSSVSQFYFQLHIFTLNISTLRKFIDGTSIFTVLVPVGAILFLCLRKRLIKVAIPFYENKAAQKRALYESQTISPSNDSETRDEVMNETDNNMTE